MGFFSDTKKIVNKRLDALAGRGDFFAEPKDGGTAFVVHIAYGWIIFILLMFSIGNVPEFFPQGVFYALMMIAVGFFTYPEFMADIIRDKFRVIGRSISIFKLGPSVTNAAVAILIGMGTAIILLGGLNIGGFGIIGTPALAVGDMVGPALFWSAIFIVLVAPEAEEIFFRAVATPTLINYLRQTRIPLVIAGIIGVVGASLLFATFHWTVFGLSEGDPLGNPLFRAAFVFGVIAAIGSYLFESYGFGLGLHIANNAIAFMALTGLSLRELITVLSGGMI